MTDNPQTIHKATQGDRPAFKQLIDLHSGYVMGICMQILKNKHEAEEAAQDTFIKMHKSLASFNGTSKFRTWLYQIAYRTAIDHYRKRKRVESIDDHPMQYNIAESHSHSAALENADLRTQLEHTLLLLKPEDAALIRMFYFKDMNIKELCEITKEKESNVKIKLFRTRKKLKELLQDRLNSELKSFIHEQ